MVNSLKIIIEKYGVNILNEERRINALLMDYAPKLQRERKLIISALHEGIGAELFAAEDSSEPVIKQVITKCIKQLMADIWITEDAAEYAVLTIAQSIGIEISGDKKKNNIQVCKSENNNDVTRGKELIKGEYPAGDSLDKILTKCETIGYKALSSLKTINKIEIPEGVKYIRAKAFMNCSELKSVKMPSSVEFIGEHIFDRCYNLENIIVERNRNYCVSGNMLIDRNNKAILRAAKARSESIKIPGGIRIIKEKAFERSTLFIVTIPESVMQLFSDSFYECYWLQRFTVDKRNKYFCDLDGVLHTKDNSKLVMYPIGKKDTAYYIEDNVAEICNKAFSKAIHLKSITFNCCIKIIGARAFEYCQELDTVVLPGSINIIKERAFQYCSKLENIMLARNITEIGDFAFCECTSLKRVSIPRAVTRIGNSAFYGCKQLTDIVIQEQVTTIGERVFDSCSSNLVIKIKNNSYVESYCKAHKIAYENI